MKDSTNEIAEEPPFTTIYLDSSGDLRLLVKDSDDRWRTLIVSSSAMCLASPVWRAMLDPKSHFKEAEKQEVDFPDNDLDALLIVLRLAHLKFRELPESVSFDGLVNLAVVSDKYEERPKMEQNTADKGADTGKNTPETADISAFILRSAWECLSSTNRALKNTKLDLIFPTEHAMTMIMQSFAFQFAPGLLQILQCPTAPTIAYFKTLALHDFNVWAVYLLVLEKHGERSRIYIGSGTNSKIGVRERMTTYERRCRTNNPGGSIPLYLEKSLQEGYSISHKCVLVWTRIPLASDQYKLRALFLVVETIFTLLFWAMKSSQKDYYMPALCPWARDSFTYDGCCTHFSIHESIHGRNEDGASAKEINRLAKEKRIDNRSKAKCTVCDLTFDCQSSLLVHQKRPVHIRKAAGIVRPLKGRGGSQHATTTKKYWCDLCQHAAASPKRHEMHINGRRHAKKVRESARREINPSI